MTKTRKQEKVLCYTGVNSKSNGIHTPDEFLNITRKFSKSKSMCYGWKDNKYKCPKKNNLDGWVEWTGAIYTNAKTCRKAAAQVQKAVKKAKNESKKEAILLEKLQKCKTRKCKKIQIAKNKEMKEHDKLQRKKCSQKNTKEFYDCTAKLYKGSKLEKLFDELNKCELTKCSKERNTLHKLGGF